MGLCSSIVFLCCPSRMKLEGEFRNGSLVKGTKLEANGDVYSGEFEDGAPSGEGSYESNLKRSLYEGNFVAGERHGLGSEVFYDRTSNHKSKKDVQGGTVSGKPVLARYNGFFCNGRRSGIGTLHFRDSSDACAYSRAKTELRVESKWLGGQPKAGGMITDLRFQNSSVPTTNKPSSKYKWLNKLSKVERHKDSLTHEELVRIEKEELIFRSTVESKKGDIFHIHLDNAVRAASGLERAKGAYQEAEMKLPSRSEYFNNCNRISAPTSQQEASESPGLRIVKVPENGVRKMASAVLDMIQSVEMEWDKLGLKFEEYRDMMRGVRSEFDLLQEKWEHESILVGTISARKEI